MEERRRKKKKKKINLNFSILEINKYRKKEEEIEEENAKN
jgi:hypothetical protein